MVTSPAQQTSALELDSPELAGMVPSTKHRMPASGDTPTRSYWREDSNRQRAEINQLVLNIQNNSAGNVEI